jgi:hypothetical protein
MPEGLGRRELPMQKKTAATPEQLKNKEGYERRGFAAAKAAILWTEALMRRAPKVDLPSARARGAAFVPALLFTGAAACDNFKIIDCDPASEEYIQASIDWIIEHPDEIQQQMDTLWPGQGMDAQELVDVLRDAEVQCGVQNRQLDKDIAGEKINDHRIVIDIVDSTYEESLKLFQDNKWVSDYSMEEIVDRSVAAGNRDDLLSYTRYMGAVATNADILAHEIGHVILGSHSKEAEHELEEQNYTPTTGEPVDEIYAWGDAAELAAKNQSKLATDSYNETLSTE